MGPPVDVQNRVGAALAAAHPSQRDGKQGDRKGRPYAIYCTAERVG